jgi:hypothetical protein
MILHPSRSRGAANDAVKREECGMTDEVPRRRRKRTGPLVFGLLATLLLAIGLAAIAFASGISGKSRPPAILGSIRLRHTDVGAGGTVRGRLIFENRTSRTKVLLRGCKVDGLYGIGLRASDGDVQAPASPLVACSPEQELVAKPGTTVYRFELRATYMACSQNPKGEPPKGSKYWNPPCLKGSASNRDIMPPLSAGKYMALFIPGGEWHGPHVKSAKLVVTRKR